MAVFRFLFVVASCCVISALWAQSFSSIEQGQLQREEQRQETLRETLQFSPDVRISFDAPSAAAELEIFPSAESPCFAVQEVSLTGEEAKRFRFALTQSLRELHFEPGMCLGEKSIQRLMTAVQNAVIHRGYTTTRIAVAPQDLSQGKLLLTVLPGRIGKIRVALEDAEKTNAGRIAVFQNEVPAAAGDIFNLRAIEQGLENLKRLPSAEADIQIVPAAVTGESDVVIRWQQDTLPFRFSFGVDDGGSKTTGRYQVNAALSFDNPLGLSDMFYAAYSHSFGDQLRFSDWQGKETGSRSRSHNFHYSVPFGNWLWTWAINDYYYHQAVAGLSENYDYNGNSRSISFGASRLLYRDARRKTHIDFSLWQRRTQSFINDAEITVQSRRMAGWLLSLSHKEYLGTATLSTDFNYKRGTGRARSQPAPEEVFGEGSSRMQILSSDIALNWPFALGKQRFVYDSRLHLQWNKTPLTPLDRLAIGGRYTVRGFDGETTLSAERGWFWRNELGWQYQAPHRLYWALDGGHVAGRSSAYLPGKMLIGTALGVKGQFNAGGSLTYDAFIATPLKKPDAFDTGNPVFGFYLNYAF